MTCSVWPKIDLDGVPYWEKDPDSTGEYGIDYTDWLRTAADDASIVNSEWTVPAGLNLASSGFDSQRTKLIISGGEYPAQYDIVNRIRTDDPALVEDRVIRIKMKQAIGTGD